MESRISRVELYNGSGAVEEATFLESERGLTVTIPEHSTPLTRGAATFELQRDGQSQTLPVAQKRPRVFFEATHFDRKALHFQIDRIHR